MHHCDAEIGKPGHWHACRARAVISRQSRSGYTMNYCKAHRERAINPGIAHFRPAYGSVPVNL